MYIVLRDVPAGELHDPFMQETVNRVSAHETVVQIPKAELASAEPGEAPAGVIFHVARCGSTLVSQLLKQHDDLVVYSEPLPFNEVLVPPHKWTRSERVGALRTLGGLFSRHAGKPYVVKLTSWNTLYCDEFAEAFPTTPWVLCIRDPLEVCVSLLQRRPGWLRDLGAASQQLFAVDVDPARASRSPEEYVARLFGAFCASADRLEKGRGRVIPYDMLPDAVWGVVAPHFGLSLSDEARKRMSAASLVYSKAPIARAVQFVPDDTAKRAAASPALRALVDALARPAFQRLTTGVP